MRSLLYTVVTMLASFCGWSQTGHLTPFLDSAYRYRSINPEKSLSFARQSFKVARNNSDRAYSLLLIGVLNNDLSRYDSSLYYLEQSLTALQSLGDSTGIGNVFHNMGVAKEHLGLYQESLDFYKQGYEIRKKLGLKAEVAFSLNSIGNIYVFLNNYSRALELYLESLKVSQELGNKNAIANTYNNIGMVHDYIGDLDIAFDYYDRARKGYEELDDKRGLAGVLNNLGLIYKNKQQPEKSIPYYQKSLKLFEDLKSAYGVAVLQNNLGVAYGMMNDQTLALQYHRQSLATNAKIGNNDGIANSNNSIGDSYLKLGQYAQADGYFRKGLEIALKIKSKDRMAESYEGLSRSREGMNDFKKALSYAQQARVLRDSLYTVEKSQKLYEMEQKYESELKEKQIALLNSETERQQLEISKKNELIAQRNIQLVLVFAALAFFGLAVYLFYSRIRIRQQARLDMARVEKEQAVIRSIHEQRMNISKDMHDEIGSGLTHIAMLSQLLTSKTHEEKRIHPQAIAISEISRQLVQSMNEIIWAINPHNESLENLIAYLREQTSKYFESLQIDFNINTPDQLPEVKLDNLQRRNLFLVIKESLNNAMKYSCATAIKLTLLIQDNILCFEVSDNGKGFEADNVRSTANGLRNMKSRMEEIGGAMQIASSSNGTIIRFNMPLPPSADE